MTEMSIVLGVMGAVLGGIWGAYSLASQKLRVQDMNRAIISIMTTLQNINTSNPGSMNIGSDLGCRSNMNACPAPAAHDPVRPGNYLVNSVQTCGIPVGGGAEVCQSGQFGLEAVNRTQNVQSSRALPSGCQHSEAGYYGRGAINNGTFTSAAITMGIIPKNLVKSATTLASGWGAITIGSVISGDSSCGANSAAMATLEATGGGAPSLTLNAGTAGYVPGVLTFAGRFFINFSKIPKSDCANFLLSGWRTLISGGLYQICIGPSGSPGNCTFGQTVSGTTKLKPNAVAFWCTQGNSTRSAVSMELRFASTH